MEIFVTLITTGDGVETYTFTHYVGCHKEIAIDKGLSYELPEENEGYHALLQTWKDGIKIEEKDIT